jgi:hypothetical protein
MEVARRILHGGGTWVLSALAALGIAELVGAWLQAGRERQERMRERMIVAADEFLTASMESASALRFISDTDDPEEERARLDQAERARMQAYRVIPRLGLLFPYERVGGQVTGAHEPASKVANGYASRSRRSSRFSMIPPSSGEDRVFKALSDVGYWQGVMAGYVNGWVWSRRLRHRRRSRLREAAARAKAGRTVSGAPSSCRCCAASRVACLRSQPR